MSMVITPALAVKFDSNHADLFRSPRHFAAGIDMHPEDHFTKRTPVRVVMEARLYSPVAIGAALAWLASRGTIRACPIIDVSDYDVIDAAYRGTAVGTVVPKPLPAASTPFTPAPVDAYEPSAEDQAEAAAMFNAMLARPAQARRMGLVPSAVAAQIRRNA